MSCWISEDFGPLAMSFNKMGDLVFPSPHMGSMFGASHAQCQNCRRRQKISHLSERQVACCPKAPCREYLHFPLNVPIFHRAFGVKHLEQKNIFQPPPGVETKPSMAPHAPSKPPSCTKRKSSRPPPLPIHKHLRRGEGRGAALVY